MSREAGGGQQGVGGGRSTGRAGRTAEPPV